MDTSTSARSGICPFLGLSDDPKSLMAYISPQNCCHHCHPILPIKLEHQNEYCLDSTYVNCPAYTAAAGRPLPSALRYKGDEHRRGRVQVWLIVVVVLAILAGIFLLLRGMIPGGSIPSATPSQNSAPSGTLSLLPSATVTMPSLPSETAVDTLPPGTPTVSPFPSLTPTFPTHTPTKTATTTLTSTLSPTAGPSVTPSSSQTVTVSPTTGVTVVPTQAVLRTLETPIGLGQAYLIHRVAGGENLNTMAEKYHTSIEAILAVNHTLAVPIWVDTLIVIPLDVTSPQGLPVFEPYQLTETGLTAEALAEQLGCDPAAFKSFNELADGEMLKKGDWFLVPRDRPPQP